MEMDKKGEDQLKPVFFAAGTATLMACIQRAVFVSVFVHWRLWAFLVLNLLLLAILFTSKKSSQTPLKEIDRVDDDETDLELKNKKKKKRRQEYSPMVSTSDVGEHVNLTLQDDKATKNVDDNDDEDDDQLSKEELNQRVEAFIAMFRQHLVSDAKDKSYELHYRNKCVPVTSGQGNSPTRQSFSHNREYIYT